MRFELEKQVHFTIESMGRIFEAEASPAIVESLRNLNSAGILWVRAVPSGAGSCRSVSAGLVYFRRRGMVADVGVGIVAPKDVLASAR